MRVLEQAACSRQLKKGANETTKTLNRSITELIVLARDATPLEIILHLPLLCEDKVNPFLSQNVPYIFVSSKAELGQACGSSRPVVACSILKDKGSALQKDINNLLIQVERRFYNA